MSTYDWVVPLLEKGALSLEGQFLWGSNYTLLVNVTLGEATQRAVYKPTQGERPLWDFPSATLSLREVAAYQVSEALQWSLVPPTVLREDGPYGPGSLQFFIEHDPNYHFFNFTEEEAEQLQPVALFDILVNNADRKGGHFLVAPDKHVWMIDHGLCFHEEPKLRTVLWNFAGRPIPEQLCADLSAFRAQLLPGSAFHASISSYLSASEIKAMIQRVDQLLAAGKFPHPPPHMRPYPWPLV